MRKLFQSKQHQARANSRASRRQYKFETLEDRRLLAVVWANQGSATNDSDQFGSFFAGNAAVARGIVNKAISDWNAAIQSTTPLNVTINAGNIAGAGVTTNIVPNAAGQPVSASITLDNNAGGVGWYFDATIQSDSEFDQLDTMFSGFATVPGAANSGDLYTTAIHELGHALGYSMTPGLAIQQFLTTGPGTGQVTFNNPSGQFSSLGQVIMTTTGGLHSTDPNDLMFRDGYLGNRKLISNNTVMVLANAYGYSVPINNGMPMLPSSRNTLHVNVDPNTQTVTVVGLRDTANDFVTVQVSTPNATPNFPNSYSIAVGSALEFIPNTVLTFNVNTGNGNDTVYVSLDNSPNLFGTINLNTGAGVDAIFYQSFDASLADFELRLTGNTIDRIHRFGGASPTRRVNYSNIETLNLYTGPGADLVTLSPTTTVNPSLSTVTVTAYDGADIINASGSWLPVEIYAGWGNDTVTGSAFADIIVGDTGNDWILGGNGRDLIIGGTGLDTISANSDSDEDIVVSGTTSFDLNRSALRSIRSEWISTRTRAQRIAYISGASSGGNNGANYLNASTVFNDNVVDSVFAQANVDWFIS